MLTFGSVPSPLFAPVPLLHVCNKQEQKHDSRNICHWNLNGISAHNFIKLSLLHGYNTDRNFDMLSLSETFFNSSLDKEDDRLKIEAYKFDKIRRS